MPPAGSRGDFDRAGFDAPDAGQRGRQDRGRPERGRGEPGAAPLPSPAAHGDAGEAEAAARQDLYGAPVAMPFRAPRKGSRCRMTCPAAVTRAAVAVRSRPVTRKPTGRSRRRVPVALRGRPAPQGGGVRRPVTTPAASGAPRNLPGTARAARSRSAGKRSTSIAGESPHPARSAATAARRRDRPGPARRARSRGLTPTRLPVRGGRTLPRSLRARRVSRHRARPRRACPAHRARRPTVPPQNRPLTAGPAAEPPRPDARHRGSGSRAPTRCSRPTEQGRDFGDVRCPRRRPPSGRRPSWPASRGTPSDLEARRRPGARRCRSTFLARTTRSGTRCGAASGMPSRARGAGQARGGRPGLGRRERQVEPTDGTTVSGPDRGAAGAAAGNSLSTCRRPRVRIWGTWVGPQTRARPDR